MLWNAILGRQRHVIDSAPWCGWCSLGGLVYDAAKGEALRTLYPFPEGYSLTYPPRFSLFLVGSLAW